jgi:hypothetical protein
LLRIDRVVLDQATGTASVLTGAAVSAGPVPPAIPAGRLPCAQIALAAATTAITDDLITDERNLAALGLGSAARYAIGTAGATVPLLSGANTWSGAQSFTATPTAPTPAYGDSSTRIATMAAINQAFTGGQSLASPGYQKLPGGLILQWGSIVTPASGHVTVTFPIAFPGTCLAMFAIAQASADQSAPPYCAADLSPQAGSANIYVSTAAGAGQAFWLALGR